MKTVIRVCFALQLIAQVCLAQSNILYNGSFEAKGFAAGWSSSEGLGGEWDAPGAPDGRAWAWIGTTSMDWLYQDVAVVVGRAYNVSFAMREVIQLEVSWNDTLLGGITNSAYGWQYTNYAVTATTTTARLRFYNPLIGLPAYLDDIRIVWRDEPVAIGVHPQSRSAFVGGGVTYSVVATGAAPLVYQWLFNGEPLTGMTNSILSLGSLGAENVGGYAVTVSNHVGAVTSQTALLELEVEPEVATILVQPEGRTVTSGYSVSVGVAAIGAPPLEYQWMLGGTNLPAATNSVLRLNRVDVDDSGSYRVLVSNALGSVLSLSANLVVTNGVIGGSRIGFNNRPPLNRPIFDIDGTTLLPIEGHLVSMYGGPTPDLLYELDHPTNLFFAGYFADYSRFIPDVPHSGTAYVQIRAWESAKGASYEAARARGGKFGRSNIFPQLASASGGARLDALESFKLQTGISHFARGKLDPDGMVDGRPQWILTGEPGFSYVIEKSTDSANWYPLLVLSNEVGTARFVDPEPASTEQFYRARIID